ncbi:MAG: hypothetical protein IKX14_06905, partial [Neisseriaceae bacterium]|nr:hypothetical protein [Neisseriaceae bacterium]
NKFGDNAPYDNYDAVNELYYTAIRYLRYGAWQWDGTDSNGKPKQKPAAGTSPDGALPYALPSTITSQHKDGFPVIGAGTGKWPKDPLREDGDEDADMQCYSPSIIVLGDSNTHADNNLPNYPGRSAISPTYENSSGPASAATVEDDNVASYPTGTQSSNGSSHYYQEVCKLSGFCPTNSWTQVSGSNDNADHYAPTFGMAGMAYWVKTNDVRPDIAGNQYITSFFIDVLEGNYLKAYTGKWSELFNKDENGKKVPVPATSDSQMANAYYLAGKFASVKDYETKTTPWTYDDFDSNNENTRPNWTSNDKGKSSEPTFFPLGMPTNYAIANNPVKVRDALIEAFKVVGLTKNTMQSGIQYNSSDELQISGTSGAESLVGSGSGNAITQNADGSYTISESGKTTITEKARQGEIPLALRAGYRFSQRTGYLTASVLLPGPKDDNDVMSGLVEVPVWEAGSKLYTKYHNASYTDRKNRVYSNPRTGSGANTITSGFTKLEWTNTDLQNLVKGDVFEPDDNGSHKNYFNDRTKLSATAANAENLIKYILGDPSQEGEGGLRQRRDSLLGTSVYSSVTPILKNTEHDFVRTVPLGDYNEKTCYYNQSTRSQDYAAMSSNEGMLHIFDMAGNEKFAYMPQTALPYIANFASPDYELRDHRFVNDGTSVIHEVCQVSGTGGTAKTYLVGTSGRGASSIYAIDVTNDNFTPKLEINAKTDNDIGILVSGPLVINDGNNTPVLIFSSGYNAKPTSNTAKGYLFFYKLNGERIAKVELGSQGVGAPFGYDHNGDGVVDRIYVGDHDGNIWRVNSSSNGTWGSARGEKLFNCVGSCQPITGHPVVGKVPNGKTVVLAGTGEYFNLDDMRASALNNIQNYAYGIFDEAAGPEDHRGITTVDSDSSALLVQEFGTESKT